MSNILRIVCRDGQVRVSFGYELEGAKAHLIPPILTFIKEAYGSQMEVVFDLGTVND